MAMAEAMRDLNLRYFAGREYLNEKDVIISQRVSVVSGIAGKLFKSLCK